MHIRVLIISDIHSNLEALQAVLDDARNRGGFSQIWSLGDVVGYGPNPRECLDLLTEHDIVGVAGNHDLACCGKISPETFNPDASAAVWWTITQITFEDFNEFLDLPLKMEVEGFTMAHGSPKEPFWEEYLVSEEIAADSFTRFDTPVCLVGHAHRAFVCRNNGAVVFEKLPPDEPVALGKTPCIVNPGSVGQPRDGDPRASYAVYDSDAGTLTHHRAEYDVAETQRKMKECGLPRFLTERPAHGM